VTGEPCPLRHLPHIEIIYVLAEASKPGYAGQHPDWHNLCRLEHMLRLERV
jgi:hypothetical protein